MKSAIGVFIVFFSLLILTLVNANTVNAQVGQLWETIVGNPADQTGPVYDDEGIESGGTGPDDLGPGEFNPPFRCGLRYWGWSYYGHTDWAVDFNRGDGDTDKGDPVLASADGVVINDTYKFNNGQITIKHEGGWTITFAHMQNISVKNGSRVSVGQKIGEISDICASFVCKSKPSPHLHVQHQKDGVLKQIVYNGKPYPMSVSPARDTPKGPLISGVCP